MRIELDPTVSAAIANILVREIMPMTPFEFIALGNHACIIQNKHGFFTVRFDMATSKATVVDPLRSQPELLKRSIVGYLEDEMIGMQFGTIENQGND